MEGAPEGAGGVVMEHVSEPLGRVLLGIRVDLRADDDRCERCGQPLADGEVRRIGTSDAVDVVVMCQCGRTTIIPWSRDAA